MKVTLKDFVPPVMLGPIRSVRRLFYGAARKKRDAIVPPGPKVKQEYVKEYGKCFGMRTFVETGTYLGDMVNAVKKDFSTIYSIELSKELHERALQWFSDYEHVHLIQGDSGRRIKELTEKIGEPCLFWLDAHYSGGITAQGVVDTPIMEELSAILARRYKDVILIDDARCFIGADQYPTVEAVQNLVMAARPGYAVYLKDDIIFIHPR